MKSSLGSLDENGEAILATNCRRGWLFAVLLLGGSCGDNTNSPSSPSEAIPLSEEIETEDISFHFAPGDGVESNREQIFHDWAIAELGVTPTRKVDYRKYRHRQHMGELTGNYNTNAYADPSSFALHTIWAFDNHEPVHLYTSSMGSPVGLLNEGIAVALQTDPANEDLVPRWSGTPIHDLAARFNRDGSLIPLGDMLETDAFRQFDTDVKFPEAGSFVRFLMDTYGMASMKELFREVEDGDSAASVAEKFEDVYRRELAAIEHDWLRFLDER